MLRLQLQLHIKVHQHNTVARHAGTAARGRLRFSKSGYESNGLRLLDGLTRIAAAYPVVIINWVQYLGPPGPFSFPDSRDLLEVLRRTFLAEREPPREDLGRRRAPEVRDTEPS